MTAKARFEAKYRVTPACWIWIASVDTQGYGQSYATGVGRGAHRDAYELYVGAIPSGGHVLHACDNRRCVNPSHLFLGNHIDNMRDRNRKGRQARNFGERGGGSKLTAPVVLKIKSDQRAQRIIAEYFGVSQQLVSFIKNGRRWPHLKETA